MCILLTGRPTTCPDVSTLSIVSVGMHWKFSLSCRQVSLTAGRCLVKGATSGDLIGEFSVPAVEGRLGPLGWGASITTRLPSPGWSSGMPSGLARNCFQCNWSFRQSVAGVVLWRSLLTMPSFTAQLCGRCASFLKVTWFASWMESSSSWKPVLCAAMWYRSWSDRNIMFLWLLGIMRVVIWTTRKKELYEDESFSSQTLVAFYKHQIKVKIRSERRRLFSLKFGKRWVTVVW